MIYIKSTYLSNLCVRNLLPIAVITLYRNNIIIKTYNLINSKILNYKCPSRFT